MTYAVKLWLQIHKQTIEFVKEEKDIVGDLLSVEHIGDSNLLISRHLRT